MSGLKIRKELKPGINKLVTDELEFLEFSLLLLEPGQEHEEALTDMECVIALLAGEVEAESEGTGPVQMGPRRNVFDDLPSGIYLPGGLSCRIKAKAHSELALSYAAWKDAKEPAIVTPDQVVVQQRGNPGYRREVRDIAVKEVQADSLLVGETVNYPGEWSSYPPHKHDTPVQGVESRLEEIYFYKIRPAQGFGYQRVYTQDRSLDEAITVENNDLVILPKGYHPVAAAPGYSVYYFWALAGPERVMMPCDDPEHQWVAEK